MKEETAKRKKTVASNVQRLGQGTDVFQKLYSFKNCIFNSKKARNMNSHSAFKSSHHFMVLNKHLVCSAGDAKLQTKTNQVLMIHVNIVQIGLCLNPSSTTYSMK